MRRNFDSNHSGKTKAVIFLYPASDPCGFRSIYGNTANVQCSCNASTLFVVQIYTMVQKLTPPQLVGKIIAALISIAMCGQPIGQAIYGILFDIFESRTWIVQIVAAITAFLVF